MLFDSNNTLCEGLLPLRYRDAEGGDELTLIQHRVAGAAGGGRVVGGGTRVDFALIVVT